MDFTGKVVLVTGASAGIGEATALQFAQLGAQLALVGRDARALHAAAERCARAGAVPPLELCIDLATDEGCEAVARETLQHYGRLDVLVNNAAVGVRENIHIATMESFDRVFAVNLRAVYNLTRLLVPALVATRGNIVNVSSIMATTVAVGNLPYSMSKAALDHFSRIIAYELAPKGVRVNVVSPGITVSTFVQRLTGYSDEEYAAWLAQTEKSIPLGRASTGADCAHMIVHLASARSGAVTGAVVPVDGALQFVGAGGNSAILKDQVKDAP